MTLKVTLALSLNKLRKINSGGNIAKILKENEVSKILLKKFDFNELHKNAYFQTGGEAALGGGHFGKTPIEVQ